MRKENMKKIIYIATVIVSSLSLKAQVNIGAGNLNGGSTESSVLLEFNNLEKKGVILPWVKSVSEANLLDNTASPNGTFVLDRSDKYVKAKINNTWQNLNYLANNTNIIPVNTIDANKTERVEAQVIIGSPNSSAKGILVLESIAKAMVLPKFRNVHKSIVNPAPGMVVFDDTPGKEQICVYNGTEWSFWTWK
ncbi:hypothetical protein RF678_04165 [Riemerella anatipestifer]|uniref:Uncharacterized protein n=2 Tax=Riemerella anatipestifer TaxID=34085 RepID=H8MDH5_RIEAD|nr:hypothetical protein [Riemerella anatipestifer]ADZ11839.1 hypothetical protein RIA_0685 [Riemerella anatipestifer RA-GD]AFD56682.1 hypothetical protein RA0C_1801 [Riemerella anatipestifer ATCC 11845 = DSM 15868]AGC39341.1 hypothetical protein G148_0036 [Riemerella anatipestifer RA-CH-2]MCQ4063254.1 hypothetical protein [Riemerella anatipestifer]MCU7586804.1 hypothetical protein [Riemerella anatipestifer]